MRKFYLFIIFLFLSLTLYQLVFAGYTPPFGGEYTNLCGTGTTANFYACEAICDIITGKCTARTGEWIFVYTCSGRQIECRSNEVKLGPGSTAYVTNYASVGSDKTVQIDVFNKDCRAGGGWSCTNSNLKGYIVWWSGTSGGGGSGGGGGSQIQCNENEVQLSVIPNPSNVGDWITFKVTAGDASTWWRNEFSGGVTNCTETIFGWETRCRAYTSGTFTWTRIWKHCVGDINNCSQECRKSVTFTINRLLPPVVITLPPVVTY
jgi:hypothetical protein